MRAHQREWMMKGSLAVICWLLAWSTASAEVFDQFFRYADVAHREFYGGLPEETIDPFSGTLHIVQTDLVLPGKAGLDLRIVRSYNSRIWNRTDDTSLASLVTEEERSVLGYGWRFHMGRIRNPNSTGQPTSPCSGDYPLVEMPDGSARVFYRSSADSRVFVSRDYWRMEQNCTAMGGGGKGTCIWSTSGVRYEFSPTNAYYYGEGSPFTSNIVVWPLSRIVDRFGNQISVTYVPQGSGAISSITDSYDRTVTFTYVNGGDGLRLSTMTANYQVYSYLYTPYATIGSVSTSPRRFLTEVKPPNGPSYKYAYAMNATVATNQYALSAMTYPQGGSVNYTYQSSQFYYGFPGYTVPFATVASKSVKDRGGSSLGTWSYAYTSPSSGASTTKITRPDGKSDVYTMYGFGNVSAGSLWKVGLTQQISRGTGAEVETQIWNPGPSISASIYSAPAYTICAGAQPLADSRVYVPRMTQRSITRDGDTYTTAYNGFDDYGQPLEVVETGQQIRSTSFSYQYVPDEYGVTLNLVHGLTTTQRVCVSGSCFDNSWTYRGPHFMRDGQTLTGVTTSFGYDSIGNLATVTNARGQILRLDSYSYGLPTRLDFNGAFTVTQTPTWEGWLKSRTDGAGKTTTYTYDGSGRVTQVAPQIGPNSSYGYASDGTTVTLTRGRYTQTTTLDGLGRTTATVDSEGVRTSARYDTMGRTSFKSYPYDATGGEVGDKYDYDPIGRLLARTKAYRPASAKCDVSGGCKVSITYSKGCSTTKEERVSGDAPTTKQCFASFGNPDETRLVQVTDANSKIWSYSYNAFGKLRDVTAPLTQANRGYAYDAVRQFLLSETTPESGTTSYDPNEIGQPRSRTDARGATAYMGYDDPLSRLRSIRYQGGSGDDVTQDYDQSNNLRSVASPNGGTRVYGYDGVNRVTSETWTYGGKTYTTTYKYDQYGCPYSIQYPTGLALTNTCDSANRIKTMSIGSTTIVKDVTYHPSGQVAKMTYGDTKSTMTTLAYDDRARVKSVTASTSGVLGLTYTYDGADNVLSFKNSVVANSSRTMTYDKLNRLLTTTAQSLWGTAAYDYDEVGNRKLKSVGSYTSNYNYDSKNRLNNATINTDTIRTATFTWSSAGRLASSSDGATYFYDGQGRRIRKSVGTSTTLYHYDVSGKILSETLADGTKLRDYIYLGNKLIAVDGCMEDIASSSCSDRQWYHTDTLGSVLARTNSSGAAVARFDYQPWGEQWSVPAVQGDRQYNGRVYDSGTGFHDYGARMYWPALGRFVSPDPAAPNLKNTASFNRYSYVYDNPYKYTDPNGEVPFLVVTGGIGVLAGGAWGMYTSLRDQGHIDWGTVGKDALIGGGIGLGLGAGAGLALAGSATASVEAVGVGAASLAGMGGATTYKIAENLQIPTSVTNSGQTVRILPSAIKHLQEAAARSQTFTTPLNMKLLGESYTKAVNAAMQSGLKFGEKMNKGGWELIFQEARDGGAPVLIHALQK